MQPETRLSRTYQNLPAVIADELREAILNGEIQAVKDKNIDLAKDQLQAHMWTAMTALVEALKSRN